MDEKELQEYLHNMGKKERRELTARLRLVKPKRKKHTNRNFGSAAPAAEAELSSRGFDGSESEIDLLLRGGSIPSGAGLRIFYRTSVCRKMTNGVSGTDSFNNSCSYLLIRELIEIKTISFKII
jgi:hypothetical protein